MFFIQSLYIFVKTTPVKNQEFQANSHLRFSMKPDPCEFSISLRLVYIMQE